MKMTLGFSPCPNDTFIFDAMIHQKIDTEGLEFEVKMADVKELNEMAFEEELDITKLSFHAYAHVFESYILLNAGSALGFGCGPLLIAREQLDRETINAGPVAIPGKYTTANFLLGLAYPDIEKKEARLFSEIEEAVVSEEAVAGLIIHENRFTYQKKGLHKIIDLGAYWENKFQLPIPLGGIFCRRNFDSELTEKIDRVIRRSVEFAFKNPDSPKAFIQEHAQEMDPEVQQKHIDLYVNEFSINLGKEGQAAIKHLFDYARSKKIIPNSLEAIFHKSSE